MSIFKKILKILGWVFLILVGGIILLFIYFNFPVSKENQEADLGVTFSSRYAKDIGLDWKQAFIAVMDDLKVKKIRIPVYWNLVEKQPEEYNFSDIDWQLAEARKRKAEIILVVGQKVPRWPECAIPDWLKNDDQKRKEDLLKFIEVAVRRYENNPEIKFWQVENEPFLKFGICPDLDVDLLDQEIALVKSLDSSRPVIVTDSGELSFWVRAASRADIFGTTMYRTVYSDKVGQFAYPIGPRFFHFKSFLSRVIARQNRIIVVELQAEPWTLGYTTQMPLEEQFKSMDSAKLADNVSFARKTGFPEIYLWGVEWWYWLAAEKQHPELWETARELFK